MNDFPINLIQDLIQSTLGIDVHHFQPPYDDMELMDRGLYKALNRDFDYRTILELDIFQNAQKNYIHFIQNSLDLNYAFLLIPDTSEYEFLTIGPYIFEIPDDAFYKRIMDKNQFPASLLPTIKNYFQTIPVTIECSIIASVHTIASYLFPSYDPKNIKIFQASAGFDYSEEPDAALNFSMEILEQRYAIENDLLEAVKAGDSDSALYYIQKFTQKYVPRRFENPLRNLKNTLLILNTLCRKATEAGMVHPFYIDKLSEKIAVQIEAITDSTLLYPMTSDITRKYCMLVKNYSLAGYSHTVRKMINYINLNLSSPLSLSVIAEALNLNPTYLSAQFRKEYGTTLTDFIHAQRIQAAIKLLNSTELPIQEIADKIGLDDLSYFSKLFKKQLGMSPLKYRQIVKAQDKSPT
ncbi:helix-turn-helix transcriptional regulator [Anaerobium acetethylicum]|uniref:AraC-type DNA-binding protein n=1 Tax=Anaerobium acetethylicum TaxID=1619234 RepID=A0A1D3TR50_9FIRM|nr:helix-turn-helix transcriptional regulator [Anaerobium acetethylicum]SCP96124.1 AraC-type DNA-binding protein [Anaerobium acetethylicum]